MLRKNLETIFEECNQNGIFVAIDETCETYILDKKSLRKIFLENPQYFGYMYLQIGDRFEFVEEIKEEGSAEVYFGFDSLTVKNLNKTATTIMSIFKKYSYEVGFDKQKGQKFYIVLSDSDVPSSYMKYLCENFSCNDTEDDEETHNKETTEEEEEEENNTEDEEQLSLITQEKSDEDDEIDEESEHVNSKSGEEDEEESEHVDLESDEDEDESEHEDESDHVKSEGEDEEESEHVKSEGEEREHVKSEEESECESDESCPEGCVCWNCRAEKEEEQ